MSGLLGLTVAEVAQQLGVSQNTIRRWCDEGYLEARRTPGRQRRVTQEAIERFLQNMEQSRG